MFRRRVGSMAAAAARVLAAASVAAVACSSGLLQLSPPDVNPAMVPAIAARVPVAVRAELDGHPPYALPIGTGEKVDDDAFTTALVERVSAALEALHVTVDPNAERVIRLRVTHVSARLAGMRFECAVDFNRQLVPETVEGLQARSADVDVHHACSFAVKEAATTVLADGAVRRYLEAP